MLDDQKRLRFQALRQRELERTLTEVEQVELSALLGELEAAEAVYLSPAADRLRKEREQLEQQNAALRELIQRREALAARLHSTLKEARTEREAIEEELSRILQRRVSAGTGVPG